MLAFNHSCFLMKSLSSLLNKETENLIKKTSLSLGGRKIKYNVAEISMVKPEYMAQQVK